MSVVDDLIRDAEVADKVLALLRYLCWRFEAKSIHFYTLEGAEVMAFTIPAGESKVFKYVAKDAYGNRTTVQSPVASTSDPNMAEATADEAAQTMTVTSSGPMGTGQARMDADADLGEGTKPIFGLLDFEVVPGEAVIIEFEPEV